MQTAPTTLAQEIANFSPDHGDWGRLDLLVQGLWSVGTPRQHVSELLALFERFPVDEDGNGVFWTILHGIEALDDYEQELADSLIRRPSQFAVLLAGRMLNAGRRGSARQHLFKFWQASPLRLSVQLPSRILPSALYVGQKVRTKVGQKRSANNGSFRVG